jgi:hypothetical protein
MILHGGWTEELAEKANRAAEQGKLVVALPGPDTDPKALAALIGVPGLKLEENEEDKYAMLASVDFEHPVLVPFARAQIRDFTKVRFWKYRKITFSTETVPEDLTVLAEFDSGTPAWMVKPVGKGSVFVFLSGWEPRESQFALSSKFVPVLYSIFENAGYSAKAAPTYYVGEVDVLNAGKTEVSSKPGLFATKLLNGDESKIGVNLHPSEGRVDPIDPNHLLADFNISLKADQLAKMKDAPTDAATKKRLETEEKEANQKLWKWLVIAVLLFLIAETWLSGRRAKSPSDPAPAAA